MSYTVGEPVLAIEHVRHTFAARAILEDVSLTVHAGDRLGLLGVNGAGKTTLMRAMAGDLVPDAGQVIRKRGLRVGFLPQELPLDPELTVLACVQAGGADLRAQLAEYQALTERLHDDPTLMDAHADLSEELERSGAWQLDREVETVMHHLGVPAGDRLLSSCSGGEVRRVALARTLVGRPGLLILDEPTNHLDAATIAWLEGYLENYKGSCLLVTHDRYFLDRVATRMVELEAGTLASYQGNYSDFLEAKAAKQEAEAHTERSRQNLLRRELAWVRKQPRARLAKSKSREAAYYELADQDGPLSQDEVRLMIPTGDMRLGKKIVELADVRKTLGDRVLIKGLTMGLVAGDRIGVIGGNGLGKTTLMKMLQGLEPADAGTIEIGTNTRFVYADQGRDHLDLTKTLHQEVAHGGEFIAVDGKTITVRSYMRRFLFTDDQQNQKLEKFSGGEQNRAQLAKLLAKGGNVLILDEPTNDLDLSTLRALEEALLAYSGCAFIVSHDRFFLNRVATAILAFEGDGRVTLTPGNYDRYLELQAPAVAAAKEEAPVVERAKPTARKMSYKEGKELEGMEAAIAEAEAALADLDARLADPALYSQGGQQANELAQQAEQQRAVIDGLYARWAELEAIAAI